MTPEPKLSATIWWPGANVWLAMFLGGCSILADRWYRGVLFLSLKKGGIMRLGRRSCCRVY